MPIIPQVNVGDIPRAVDENVIRAVVNALQNINTTGPISAEISGGSMNIIMDTLGPVRLPIIETLATNKTGVPLNRFEIAGIDHDEMTEIDPNIQDRLPPVILKETVDGDVGNWVVVLEPINEDKSGRVAIGGYTFVKVTRRSANSGVALRFAEMESAVYSLTMQPIGTCRVLWEQTLDADGGSLDLTEEHLALIEFGGAGVPMFAEATSAPSGGTLTVKLATSDGTLVGDDITVYDGGIA